MLGQGAVGIVDRVDPLLLEIQVMKNVERSF
jgi:hypothetical protein